jgi:hypothetical protein
LALVLAAIQQIALAVLFFVISSAAFVFGDAAQAAAQRDVAAQGIDIDGETLRASGAQFSESRVELLLPLGIGIVLIVTAVIALVGGRIGVVVTWIVEALLLVIVGYVTYGQVFPATFLKGPWARADDERLSRIDVDRMMIAAGRAFPAWLRPLQFVRFALATFGSLLVMAMLVAGS